MKLDVVAFGNEKPYLEVYSETAYESAVPAQYWNSVCHDYVFTRGIDMAASTIVKRMLMAEQWDQFARTVLPANCSVVQKREMRRAFYSGAQSILFRVIASFAPESEPTEEDIQIMEDLSGELQDFAELVKTGRA